MKPETQVYALCQIMANRDTSGEDRRTAYNEMLEIVRAHQAGIKPKQERIKLDNPDFLNFWTAYPHKVAKGYAEKALTKALKETDMTTILKGLQWYKMNKPDETPWAFPASWLNAKRWEDGQADLEKPAQPIETESWPEWKQKIGKALGNIVVNTWFKDCNLVEGTLIFDDCTKILSTIYVPKSAYQFIKDRYSIELNKIFGNVEIRCKDTQQVS